MSGSIPAISWSELESLRQSYLHPQPDGSKDYWISPTLLWSYHQTFGARIGWKWDSVLADIARQTHLRESFGGSLLDYGCGTGMASLRVLNWLAPGQVDHVYLYDRSPKAMLFAADRIKEQFPGVRVEPMSRLNWPQPRSYLLLASHIFTEINRDSQKDLLEGASKSQGILFVDAGTKQVSEKLIGFRRDLGSNHFRVLAPCSHQNACPLSSQSHPQHWCHFFAKVPQIAFQSSFWREFSEKLSIDLRSLPLSYLVMQEGTARSWQAQPLARRILGRGHHFKSWIEWLSCSEVGIEKLTITKRQNKEGFKLARKQDCLASDWLQELQSGLDR